MKSIEEFIKARKLLSCNGLEKMIGAPTGTIRNDGSRRIPVKYKQAIIDIIKHYGYSDEQKQIEPVGTPVVDIVDNHMMEFTYRNDSVQFNDGIWRRAKLKPDSKIFVHENDVL